MKGKYTIFKGLHNTYDQKDVPLDKPITHWNDAFPEIKRLLFNLLIFISIAGNILDLRNVGYYAEGYVNYINYVYILIAATIFLLERIGKIPLHCSTNVIIYALLINILTSLNIYSPHFAELYMRETIFIGIILIVAGIINRNNILILGFVYFAHHAFVLVYSKDEFLLDNTLIMSCIIVCYIILIYYILRAFQMGMIARHNLSFQLYQSNKTLDEQKKQLEESETKYRMLADNAGDFIATYNNKGEITYSSPSVKSILGFLPHEILNKNALSLVHLQDLKEVKSSMAQTIQGSKAVSCQYRAKRSDGTYIWVEAIMQKTNTAENRYLTIIRDISLRKKVQTELELANQTKDKFFSIIAHDLKSPMSQIYSSSHFLHEKFSKLSIEDQKMLAKNLFSGAEKLYFLLDDLLLWSRSQMNRIPIHPENCDVKQIVEESIHLFKSSLDAKRIRLVLQAEESPFAYADIHSVKTVIRNILSNAIKFSYPNSIISIQVAKNVQNLEIVITDNGIGITADRLSSLFEIDKSISTPGTHNETGTGLGMIICKELIEKNQGMLLVESEVSKGTTFKVILPNHAPSDN